MIPQKIKFPSDQNELEYRNKIKDHYIYQYTVSETKKDRMIGWTLPELEKLLTNKTIIAL